MFYCECGADGRSNLDIQVITPDEAEFSFLVIFKNKLLRIIATVYGMDTSLSKESNIKYSVDKRPVIAVKFIKVFIISTEVTLSNAM